MIPSIRSLSELMIITQPGNQPESSYSNKDFECSCEDSGKRKRYLDCNKKREIHLPDIAKRERNKWIKSSEAVSKFFDELDYNNQIQPSYELTLIERQKNYDYYDIA
tara:strand:+ start:475 stop:795 length:321 start_codon:yes stop_codon:yes gene_type:complete